MFSLQRLESRRERGSMPAPNELSAGDNWGMLNAGRQSSTKSRARSAAEVGVVRLDPGRPGADRRLRRGHRGPPVHPCRSRGRGEDAVRRHDRARLPHSVAAQPDGRRRHARPRTMQDGRSITASTRSASSPRSARASASAAVSPWPRSRRSARASGSSSTASPSRSRARTSPALIADWIGLIFM